MSTKHKKSWQMGVAGFSYVSLAVAPVYASDVEIYTKSVNSTALSPVVMMMLDTSGSMKWCVDSTVKETCGDDDKRREFVMKKAMRQVLLGEGGVTAAPGYVKMGLSRYQPDGDDGGWVVYPARPLDAFVAFAPDGVLTNAVGSSAGDTTGDSGVTNQTLAVSSTADVGLYFGNVILPRWATVISAQLTMTPKADASGDTHWQVSSESSGNAQPFSTSAPNRLSDRTYVPATSALTLSSWSANTAKAVDVTEVIQRVANQATWCGGNALTLKLKDIDGNTRQAYAYDQDAAKAPQLTIEFRIDPERKDSCVKSTVTSTFSLGMQASGSPDSLKAPLDDVEYYTTSAGVTPNNTTLSINKLSGTDRNNVMLRLTTAAPIPVGATIEEASLAVMPSQSYPIVTPSECLKKRKGKCILWSTPTSTDDPQPTKIQIFKQLNMAAVCTSSSSCIKPSTSAASFSSQSVLWSPGTLTDGNKVTITGLAAMLNDVVKDATAGVSTIGLVLSNNATTTNSAASLKSAESDYANAPQLTVKWSGEVNDLSRFTTVRDELASAVADLPSNANTPLGAAYAESARYLLGKPAHTYNDGENPSRSAPDARTLNAAKTQYLSPVDTSDQCSGNYVFLLTDGEPSATAGVVDNVKNIPVPALTACTVPVMNITDTYGTGKSIPLAISGTAELDNWRCMFNLADILRQPGKNPLGVKIKTNAVFLGPDASNDAKSNMDKVAQIGGGKFYLAADTDDLVQALTRTIADSISNSGLIAAPGVAVNQYNRLNSLDQVYYVLFDPTSLSKRWNGNLKRYRLSLATEAVLDVNGNVATNADGGFKSDTKSYWSDAVDGGDSTSGGAASKLPKPSDRKIYSNIGGTMQLLDTSNASLMTAALPFMPSGTTEDVLYNLIHWYRGYEINDAYGMRITESTNPKLSTLPERKKLGGGLHSRATMVNYDYTDGTDKTNPDNQTNIIFYSTLGATLHGIDAKTGVEKFAFIPREKLGAIKTLYDNAASAEPEYGLDLTWTVWRKDVNGDGKISTAGGDKLYLYGGMRMGGNHYYALDLTDINDPKMLFTLTGGTDAYGNAGQSWSQPVLADIKVGTEVKKTLIFGGGYDMCYEDGTACPTPPKGNRIYIVNAETGDLIWWGAGDGAPSATPAAVSVSDFKYSIPSEVKVLDLNSDGLTDTVYFGDLGGQLFRMDIDNGKSGTELVKRVKLLAKLGSSGVAAPVSTDNRRIYEPPTVALFKDEAVGGIFAAVAVGTGNRSRPLNAGTSDRYAVIFDYDIGRATRFTTGADLQATADYAKLVKLDLTNDSSSGKPTYSVDTSGKSTPNTYGWYVELTGAGEKSLSSGIIYLKKLLFTTYLPTTATNDGCNLVAGETDLYQMCMPYGTQCGDIEDRKAGKIMLGLGGEPQLIYQNTGELDSDNVPLASIGTLISTQVNEEKDKLKKQLQTLKRWREKNSQ